jgi:hypothetical protein
MGQVSKYPGILLQGFALTDALELYTTPQREIQLVLSSRAKRFAALFDGRVVRGMIGEDVEELGR